jgi:tetratricopeptide (TPR) repeat protein
MNDPYRIPSAWRDGVLLLVLTPIRLSARLFVLLFGRKELGEQDEEDAPEWESRIAYRYFFLGLPAIMALGVATALTIVNSSHHDSLLLNRYLERATAAMQAADYERAELCLTRLGEFRAADPDNRFQLGLVLEAQGRTEEAAGLIAHLTPDDRVGYAPAQLWVIRRQLRGRPDDGRMKTIEAQLIRLREDPHLGRDAAVLLAELYLRSQRAGFVLDEPKLREAAESEPRLHLLVLQELGRQGKGDSIRPRLTELIRFFRSELERRPDDVDARVHLSQALALGGDLRGAVVALREGLTLKPDGPFGKMLAELLVSLAGRVQQASTLPDVERRSIYREALDAVTRHAEPSAATELRQAQLHRLLGEGDAAETHYLAAVSAFPEARLELAELYMAREQPERAREQWRRLRDHYDVLRRRGESLADSARRSAGLAALYLADYPAAVAWFSQPTTAPELRPLLVEAYVRWWDSLQLLAAKPETVLNPRLDLLLDGLAVDPRNAAVLFRLLAVARRDDRMGEQALAALRKLIADNAQKAPAYVLLGSAEYVRGNVDEAITYLEQAYRLDPDADVTLNNLAWVLATAVPPDLERALKLANAAVELTQGAVRTRETRLRILVRLGKWDEALRDVEACESLLRGQPDFHLLAAEVYNKLKLSGPAEEHRRRAEEILRERRAVEAR